MKFFLKLIFISFAFIQSASAGRMYDPEIGRFIQRDPLGYVDGMSLYNAYFAERFNTDPYGLREWKVSGCNVTLKMTVGVIFKGSQWTDLQKKFWLMQAKSQIEKAFSGWRVMPAKTVKRESSYLKFEGDVEEYEDGKKICYKKFSLQSKQELCPCAPQGFKIKLDIDVFDNQKEELRAADNHATVYYRSQRSAASSTHSNLDNLDVGPQGQHNQVAVVHEFGHMIGLQHPNRGAPIQDDEYNDPQTGQPSMDLMGAGMNMKADYFNKWVNAVEKKYPDKACKPYKAVKLD